jgi:hypothetical protein
MSWESLLQICLLELCQQLQLWRDEAGKIYGGCVHLTNTAFNLSKQSLSSCNLLLDTRHGVHFCIPSIWKADQDDWEFKISLGFIARPFHRQTDKNKQATSPRDPSFLTCMSSCEFHDLEPTCVFHDVEKAEAVFPCIALVQVNCFRSPPMITGRLDQLSIQKEPKLWRYVILKK